MSSIERRTNADSTTYRVRFRHEGKHLAIPFDTDAQATSWKAVLDTLGPAAALRLVEQTGPTPATRPRTVAEQVEHHIAHLTDITDGTRRKYRKIAKSRITPSLGMVLLPDLTPDHIRAWVIEQKVAPKTVRNALHGVLSPALNSAVDAGLIPSNPARGVKPPKRTASSGEHVYLTREEFAILLPLVPERYRLLVFFLTATGARFSEASALTVGALDLDAASARISQAWKDSSGGKPELGPPKTAKSRRTIGLPPELVAALRPAVAGRKASAYVFTTRRDTPVRNGVFHESAWQRAVVLLEEQIGKKPRVHDLRHTYASWALSANMPITVVQRQLGHESIQTTVDVYGHLVRADIDALAVTIGRMLPPSPSAQAIEVA